MQLFLRGENRAAQYAAGIISIIAEKHSSLILPYIEVMVERMAEPGLPAAVRRNVVRILQHAEIPESLQGRVMDLCYQFLADPNEPIAVRCFSMTVLCNLSKVYPQIKPELKTIIEEGLQQNASAGFKARAKKITKEL